MTIFIEMWFIQFLVSHFCRFSSGHLKHFTHGAILSCKFWCFLGLPICWNGFGGGLFWTCSLFVFVVPWRPHIVIPGLVTDIALLSLAFTRVLQSADLIVGRSTRAAAERSMTPEMWDEIQKTEGPFWGPIHRFIERVNTRNLEIDRGESNTLSPIHSIFLSANFSCGPYSLLLPGVFCSGVSFVSRVTLSMSYAHDVYLLQ